MKELEENNEAVIKNSVLLLKKYYRSFKVVENNNPDYLFISFYAKLSDKDDYDLYVHYDYINEEFWKVHTKLIFPQSYKNGEVILRIDYRQMVEIIETKNVYNPKSDLRKVFKYFRKYIPRNEWPKRMNFITRLRTRRLLKIAA